MYRHKCRGNDNPNPNPYLPNSQNASEFTITETGWPSAGLGSPQGNPSTLGNPQRYADSFASMLCSGEIGMSWMSYFVFKYETYKTIVLWIDRLRA